MGGCMVSAGCRGPAVVPAGCTVRSGGLPVGVRQPLPRDTLLRPSFVITPVRLCVSLFGGGVLMLGRCVVEAGSAVPVVRLVITRLNQGTLLRFDYDHPPRPPKPNKLWHLGKLVFNRTYWHTVPRGRI